MCTVGGVSYRLGCVHLSPSAPYYPEHTPNYRLLCYCVHIRICSPYTEDLIRVPCTGDDSMA